MPASTTTTTVAADTTSDGTPTTITFALTGSTVISAGGVTIAWGQIATGDHVRVVADTSNPGDAADVQVAAAELGGKVSAVSGPDVTLGHGHWSATVVLGPGTAYFQGHTSATSAAVVVGAKIFVLGLPDPTTPGDVDALVVYVLKDHHGWDGGGTTTTSTGGGSTTTTVATPTRSTAGGRDGRTGARARRSPPPALAHPALAGPRLRVSR